MSTASEIIKSLGGQKEVGTAIGVPVGTVGSWSSRGIIPVDYWRPLLNLAKSKRVKLTAEMLLDSRPIAA